MFWKFVWENKVKIIGVVVAVHAQLMVELSGYVTAGMLDPLTLRLVGTFGSLLGVAAAAAGFSNTQQVRVEEAKATMATAMQTAIVATPGQIANNPTVREVMQHVADEQTVTPKPEVSG